jgi:hypothetical protein
MTVNLIGTWVVDKSDSHALSELSDVSLKFGQDGSPTYVVRLHDRKQIIKLQYRIYQYRIDRSTLGAKRRTHGVFAL